MSQQTSGSAAPCRYSVAESASPRPTAHLVGLDLRGPAGGGVPRGVPNLGNTCYLAAAAQVLSATLAAFRFPMGTHPFTDLLLEVSRSGGGGDDAQPVPVKVVDRALARLRSMSPGRFKAGPQHDLHEAMIALLPHVREAIHIQGQSDPFSTKSVSTLCCKRCGYISDKAEPTGGCLTLSIAGDTNLQACLAGWSRNEVLRPGDLCHCRCLQPSHRNGQQSKQLRLRSAPTEILLALKRFDSFGRKLEHGVSFPVTGLDLAPYIMDRVAPDAAVYDLVAVGRHHGTSVHAGHCTAIVRRPDGRWDKVDDSTVTPCDPPRGAGDHEAAYVLSYRQRSHAEPARRDARVETDTDPAPARLRGGRDSGSESDPDGDSDCSIASDDSLTTRCRKHHRYGHGPCPDLSERAHESLARSIVKWRQQHRAVLDPPSQGPADDNPRPRHRQKRSAAQECKTPSATVTEVVARVEDEVLERLLDAAVAHLTAKLGNGSSDVPPPSTTMPWEKTAARRVTPDTDRPTPESVMREEATAERRARRGRQHELDVALKSASALFFTPNNDRDLGQVDVVARWRRPCANVRASSDIPPWLPMGDLDAGGQVQTLGRWYAVHSGGERGVTTTAHDFPTAADVVAFLTATALQRKWQAFVVHVAGGPGGDRFACVGVQKVELPADPDGRTKRLGRVRWLQHSLRGLVDRKFGFGEKDDDSDHQQALLDCVAASGPGTFRLFPLSTTAQQEHGALLFSGGGPKAMAQAYAHTKWSDHDDAPVLIQSLDGKDYRRFGSYRDVTALVNAYEQIPPATRKFYEYYSATQPCKLFWDYEFYIPQEDNKEQEQARRWQSFERHLHWAVERVTGRTWGELPGVVIASDSSRSKSVDMHASTFWRPSVHGTHTGVEFPDGPVSQKLLWELVLSHAKHEGDAAFFYRKPNKTGTFTDDEPVADPAPYRSGELRMLGSCKTNGDPNSLARLVAPDWAVASVRILGQPNKAIVAASLVAVHPRPPFAEAWLTQAGLDPTTRAAQLFPADPLRVTEQRLLQVLEECGVRRDAPRRSRPAARTAGPRGEPGQGPSPYHIAQPLDAAMTAALVARLPADWVRKWGGDFRQCGRNADGDILFKAMTPFCVFKGEAHGSHGNCNSGRWTKDGSRLYIKCFRGRASCYALADKAALEKATLAGAGECQLREDGLCVTFRRARPWVGVQEGPTAGVTQGRGGSGLLRGVASNDHESEDDHSPHIEAGLLPSSGLDSDATTGGDSEGNPGDGDAGGHGGADAALVRALAEMSPSGQGTGGSRVFHDPAETEVRDSRVHHVSTRFIMHDPVLSPEHVESEDQQMVWRRLVNADGQSPHIAIRSPMGSGKTAALRRLFESGRRGETPSCLWLSTRRAYAQSFGAQLRDLGFVSYLEWKARDPTPPRFICSLESLPKFVHEHTLQQYDVVVLDEVESVCAQFAAMTVAKYRRSIVELLRWRMTRAKRIIALDAHLARRGMFFLREFSGGRAFDLIINDHVRTDRSYVLLQGKKAQGEWTHRLLEAAKAGKRIVVPTNSKRQAQAVRTLLLPYFEDEEEAAEGDSDVADRTIQFYTGDASKAEREHFKLVDRHWGRRCRLLIYTPIVGAGIDFNVKHFDKMFPVAVGCSGTAAAFAQQLGRVRKLEDPRVYIHMIESRAASHSEPRRTTEQQIMDDFRSPHFMRQTPWFQDEVLDRLRMPLHPNALQVPTWDLRKDDAYVDMHMFNVQEIRLSRAVFPAELGRYLGAAIEDELPSAEFNEREEASKQRKEAGEEAEQEEAARVAAQPTLRNLGEKKELDDWNKCDQPDAPTDHLPEAVRLSIDAGTFSYGHTRRKFEIQRVLDLPGDRITAEFVHEHCIGKRDVLRKAEALQQLQRGASGVRRLLHKEADSQYTDKWVHDKGEAGLRGATLALLATVLGLGPRDVGEGVTMADVEKNLTAGGRALLSQLAKDGGLTKAPFNLRNKLDTGDGSSTWTVKAAIEVVRSLLKRSGLALGTKRHGKKRLSVYSLSVEKRVQTARLAASELAAAALPLPPAPAPLPPPTVPTTQEERRQLRQQQREGRQAGYTVLLPVPADFSMGLLERRAKLQAEEAVREAEVHRLREASNARDAIEASKARCAQEQARRAQEQALREKDVERAREDAIAANEAKRAFLSRYFAGGP